MDPTPPAWLRSYKAHSSIIPNYASQVRPDLNDSATPRKHSNGLLTIKEDEKAPKPEATENAAANPFTFPSTISLTLHNVGSLDNTYSNSVSTSSPAKQSFSRHDTEKPVPGQSMYSLPTPMSNRRRGPICRWLAAIRASLKMKTQNKLVH
ncbi:MAG: hypothetical protein Q9219_005438 [cf. Caloplaca sp. 3 TL-2023]